MFMAAAFAITAGAATAIDLTSSVEAQAPPPAVDVLPDLVADPPTDPVLQTDDEPAEGPRLLLRFNGYVHNAGPGAVEMRANRATASEAMVTSQRIYDAGTGWRDVPSAAEIIFETGDGHQHWHLKNAVRYSLWDAGRTEEAAPSMKAGFCLVDNEPVDPHAPAVPLYGRNPSESPRFHDLCAEYMPERLQTWQGISPGWRDVYDSGLAFQWVDVSDVQPGSYWLRADIDPNDVVVELDEHNEPAWAAEPTIVPGYVAQPVDGGAVPAGQPTPITLSAEGFGTPGPASHGIVSAPENGTLSLATGDWQPSPTVTYTPDPGFSGTDRFTFAVRDVASPFPRHPAVATVTMQVQGAPVPPAGGGAAATPDAPSVSIGGAPAAMTAGARVDLDATVVNDAPDPTWSADAGDVERDGWYTAPAVPPPGGSATVTARTLRGATDTRQIRILPAPEPQPAPLPEAEAASEDAAQPSLLRALRAAHIGDRLVISVRPMQRGTIRLAAYHRDRRIGVCAARTPGGRRFTCRMAFPRRLHDAAIRLTASLRRHGRSVAVVRLPAAPIGDRDGDHGHGHGHRHDGS